MNLKVERVKKNMSQSDLQLASGVSRATISNIEKHGYVPSVKVAKKLADTLGIDWHRFYEGDICNE